MKVVFCGRNETAGKQIAAETGSQFIRAHVTKHEEVASFFDQVYSLLIM